MLGNVVRSVVRTVEPRYKHHHDEGDVRGQRDGYGGSPERKRRTSGSRLWVVWRRRRHDADNEDYYVDEADHCGCQ